MNIMDLGLYVNQKNPCPSGVGCRCCECKECNNFHKLFESKGGSIIYQNTNQMVSDSKSGTKTDVISGERDTQSDDNIVITIHNTRDKDLLSSDFLKEFDINKVSCPRCRHIMTRARLFLEKLSAVEKNEIECVCDLCLKTIQEKSREPCHYCQRSLKKTKRLGLETRKEDRLKKQLMSILADKTTKVEITRTEKKLRSYSDIDIKKALVSKNKYYEPRLDKPKSLAVDSRICECDKKLTCLLQKTIESKKVKIRVKIRDAPETVRSLQEFELEDIFTADDDASAPKKSILKHLVPVPPPTIQSLGRGKRSPFRSGFESETVLGIGTTGMRRTLSDGSLVSTFSGITNQILLKNFKYVFPRMIKGVKTISKTSGELIKETQLRFEAEAEEKIRIRQEQQQLKQEKELKKMIGFENIEKIEEWAKREGINLSDIDIKTGKIRQKQKKEGETRGTAKRELDKSIHDKSVKGKEGMEGKGKRYDAEKKTNGKEKMDDKDKGYDTEKKIKVKEKARKDDKGYDTKKKVKEKKEREEKERKGDKGYDTKKKVKEKKEREEKGRGYDIEKKKKRQGREGIEEKRKEHDIEKKKKGKEYDTDKKKKVREKETVDHGEKGDKIKGKMRKEREHETFAEKIKPDIQKKAKYREERVFFEKRERTFIEKKETGKAQKDKKRDKSGTQEKETVEKETVEKGKRVDKEKTDKREEQTRKAKGESQRGTISVKELLDKSVDKSKAKEKEVDKEPAVKPKPQEEQKGTQTPRDVASGPDRGTESGKDVEEYNDQSQFLSESVLDKKYTSEKDIEDKKKTQIKSEETIQLVKKVITKHEKVKSDKIKALKHDKSPRDKLKVVKKEIEITTGKDLRQLDSAVYLDVKGMKKEKEEERKQLELAKKKPKTEPKQKETEVELKDLKIAQSGDDLILKLIKIKRDEKPLRLTPLRPVSESVTVQRKAPKAESVINIDSDLELDAESLLRKKLLKAKKEEKVAVFGQKITYKRDIPPEPEPKIKPALFSTEFDERFANVNITDFEPEIIQKPDTGPFRYALSDHKYIENGWTVLPTEKIVRKMNVYRMRPSHSGDWFEHNKNKGTMLYESGEKLAEVTPDGRGRWYYKNGRLALDYYDSEELNAQQRIIIYSSGEPDARGRPQPVTVLAMFDYLGNCVVFDHHGKIRLKYNQNEGVVLDRELGPVTHWLWHSLNEPPELQQVMIDTQLPFKDPGIFSFQSPDDKQPREDDETMLAIEFDNYIKSSSVKPTADFKPYQIRMKALKINEQFSLRVVDQETVYLSFSEGSTNMKLNLGMKLDHNELLVTGISELNEVALNMEKRPALTDSIECLQKSIDNAQNIHRVRTERELRLKPKCPADSADKLTAAASKPLRPPLLTTDPNSTFKTKSKALPTANNLYYNTRLI